MEDFSKYWSLTCCMFWILSPAEANIITTEVGSRVMLPCNTSKDIFFQITWKLNGSVLISFLPEDATLHLGSEAKDLEINMTLTGNETFTLLIDQVQMFHMGNYSCTVFGLERRWEQRWKLQVTEKTGAEWWRTNQHVMIAAPAVVCVCCLTFILTLTILRRVQQIKEPGNEPAAPVSVNTTHPNLQEQTEDVYENCLDVNYFNQPSRRSRLYEVY